MLRSMCSLQWIAGTAYSSAAKQCTCHEKYHVSSSSEAGKLRTITASGTGMKMTVKIPGHAHKGTVLDYPYPCACVSAANHIVATESKQPDNQSSTVSGTNSATSSLYKTLLGKRTSRTTALSARRNACAGSGCPPGKYHTWEASTTSALGMKSICNPCHYGHFWRTNNPNVCLTCPAGKYQPKTPAPDHCLTCPPGKFQSQTGFVGCTMCAAGYYQVGMPSLAHMHHTDCYGAQNFPGYTFCFDKKHPGVRPTSEPTPMPSPPTSPPTVSPNCSSCGWSP